MPDAVAGKSETVEICVYCSRWELGQLLHTEKCIPEVSAAARVAEVQEGTGALEVMHGLQIDLHWCGWLQTSMESERVGPH